MILPSFIVFDVAGVLLNIQPGWEIISSYLEVTSKQVIEAFNKYSLHADLGIISPEELWHNIAVDLGNKNTDGKIILDKYLSGCIPLHWGYDLALSLRSSNYQLAICTNVWSGISKTFWPNVKIGGVSIFSIFPKVIESCEVKAVKPNNAIYRIVEKTVGASGRKIFLIDDNVENVESAKNFGWQAYQFMTQRDYGRESYVQLTRMLSK